MSELIDTLEALAQRARAASRVLAVTDGARKREALLAAAASLRAASADILAANAQDMDAAHALAPALRDRLQLTHARIEAMAKGIEQVVALPDPVGQVLEHWKVEANGLTIEKRSVPIGVIGMIYESRPNVTADAGALCLASGNAVILRGGSESARSSRAIADAMRGGLASAGLPADALQLVPTQDREAVGWMLSAPHALDVIIPRGGQSLTERVARDSRVPTLLHLIGNCHIYVTPSIEIETAVRIVHNAKLRRTGICGALESLLIDRAALASHGPSVLRDLLDSGCAVRGDASVQALDTRVTPASDEDWASEYLAPILSVKVVDGVGNAIEHINRYGSHHTDAILTRDEAQAERFTAEVDSAIVLVNASTQFADGGEFGFGAEIGIATGRLHARGPVGAAQLTTYKYVVRTDNPEGATRAG